MARGRSAKQGKKQSGTVPATPARAGTSKSGVVAATPLLAVDAKKAADQQQKAADQQPQKAVNFFGTHMPRSAPVGADGRFKDPNYVPANEAMMGECPFLHHCRPVAIAAAPAHRARRCVGKLEACCSGCAGGVSQAAQSVPQP